MFIFTKTIRNTFLLLIFANSFAFGMKTHYLDEFDDLRPQATRLRLISRGYALKFFQ